MNVAKLGLWEFKVT